MSKEEFLRELEKGLRGKMDDREIARQLQYYDSFITNEINSGRTIEDVMEELGSPRLIAKTLIQTYRMKDNPVTRTYAGNNTGWNDDGYDDLKEQDFGDSIKDNAWKIFAIITIIVVLLAVIGIIFSILKIMLPVVFGIIALYILFKIVT